jgi:hypothetical protein
MLGLEATSRWIVKTNSWRLYHASSGILAILLHCAIVIIIRVFIATNVWNGILEYGGDLLEVVVYVMS